MLLFDRAPVAHVPEILPKFVGPLCDANFGSCYPVFPVPTLGPHRNKQQGSILSSPFLHHDFLKLD